MTIDTSIGKRLNLLNLKLEISQSALSKQLKVPQSFLNAVVFGKKGISAKIIINLSLAYKDLNIRWLLTGEGDMFHADESVQVKSNYPDGVAEDAGQYYPALPPDQVASMLALHERRISAIEKRLEK